MKTTSEPAAVPGQRILVIERIFDAPRELVWRAWTEPTLFMRWWGPRAYTAPVCEIDLRVGGIWRSCMRSEEGQDIWGVGTFREVVPLQRIVVTDSFADENGNAVPATHYGMPDDIPFEMLLTVTFEDAGDGKTKLTLRHEGLPEGEIVDSSGVGWNESFDKLAEMLAASSA